MEGRLHLSNISDEDPSLRRTDRGRTLSNHARHGPRSRGAASQSVKRSLIPLSLFLSDQLSLSLSLTHTHTHTLFILKPQGRTLQHSLLCARSLSLSLVRSPLFSVPH